ncbi:MAG: sulfate adenylyltransferase subunit 2 [Candidatus Nitrohelix vancouverensis]|uniref:Sulfate adenylyltransferase subunit 2 n=1 Tax=Candidatus Nitrohelix vancouverensis TaxID=2705534 RepID=A0A7T0G3F7_9BACT|nr:MAG: sulfate adenylyltransferase subunit 2 [Candidatus Nitrohelix vancouverensis]
MDHLTALENKSIFIIREAYFKFKDIALLWSMGKDSTTLLHLCRKAFFGKIPFPVLHIDTSYKFPQMYEFRDKYVKDWNLDLIVERNEDQIQKGMNPESNSKFDCCNQLKTNALKQGIEKHNFKAILLGIRRDEHGIRAKERFVSPRTQDFKWDYQDQPAELWDQHKSTLSEDTHYRIHPILHMTELDIWEYIQRENIPINELYFSRSGNRFRSIGCMPCCQPVQSEARDISEIITELKSTNTSERAGRSQDKEDAYTMQKLRALGYM